MNHTEVMMPEEMYYRQPLIIHKEMSNGRLSAFGLDDNQPCDRGGSNSEALEEHDR